MKKVLLGFSIICFSFFICKGQTSGTSDYFYHSHTGFYLSLGLGPYFGSITDHMPSQGYDMTMSGTGIEFNFNIGAAVANNFIIHFDLIGNTIENPNVTYSNGQQGGTANNIATDESIYGLGLTYFFMPANISLSGTIGLGRFTLNNSTNNSIVASTSSGLAIQLKLTKEWWISRRWLLGLGVTYTTTSATDNSGSNTEEDLSSGGVAFLLQFSF